MANWFQVGRSVLAVIRSIPIRGVRAGRHTPSSGRRDDYGPDPQYNCTNVYALQQGAIWQYVKSAGVYRCPADDRSLGGMPVVRSYSMNSWMSGRSSGDPTGDSNFTTPGGGRDADLRFVPQGESNRPALPNVVFD